MDKNKIAKFERDAINKQFEINGYKDRFENIAQDPYWFRNKTTTPDKDLEWMRWMQKEIMKRFKLPEKAAKVYAGLFSLSYGLTIPNK